MLPFDGAFFINVFMLFAVPFFGAFSSIVAVAINNLTLSDADLTNWLEETGTEKAPLAEAQWAPGGSDILESIF